MQAHRPIAPSPQEKTLHCIQKRHCLGQELHDINHSQCAWTVRGFWAPSRAMPISRSTWRAQRNYQHPHCRGRYHPTPTPDPHHPAKTSGKAKRKRNPSKKQPTASKKLKRSRHEPAQIPGKRPDNKTRHFCYLPEREFGHFAACKSPSHRQIRQQQQTTNYSHSYSYFHPLLLLLLLYSSSCSSSSFSFSCFAAAALPLIPFHQYQVCVVSVPTHLRSLDLA